MAFVPKNLIVVPIDFSAESLEAVDFALTLVTGADHLEVVHVLPVLAPMEPGVVWDTIDDESRCQHAEEELRRKLAADKYKGIRFHVYVGDPGHEITDHAQEVGADLIVLPSHGRTGIKRLLIGSVAERVVRLAHCPVLVLRK